MHVLFVARPDLESKPGGDTIQICRTREEFDRLGIAVTLAAAEGNPRFPAGTDLLHCFNLRLAHQFEAWLGEAARRGIPALLSPVFWHSREFELRSGVVGRWKRSAFRAADALLPGRFSPLLSRRFKSLSWNPHYRRYLARIANGFSMLLPNAAAEAGHLRDLLGVRAPMRVVYNAARLSSAPLPPPPSIPARFILNVGRIEFRKNQLNLIRAMRGVDAHLLLVGDVNPTEKRYWDLCRAEARALGVDVRHIPHSPFDLVAGLYGAALLHAQPSWVETPGLASLEAAAAGCPILCTRVGSAPEYFGDRADYCEPGDVESIRSAIRHALALPPDRAALRSYVAERFTWKKTAEACARIYGEILGAS